MTQDVAAARVDLERLAKLADEATPGPWVHEKSGDWDMVRSEIAHVLDGEPGHFLVANLHHGGYVYEETGYTPEKVAAFIAAANPATIKALLARVAALEDSNEGLTADLSMAVQTAYNRGATEWARLNYPQWAEWLDSQKGGGA